MKYYGIWKKMANDEDLIKYDSDYEHLHYWAIKDSERRKPKGP